LLEALGELAQNAIADILHDRAAEAGLRAGDLKVRLRADPHAGADLLDVIGDRRERGALPLGLPRAQRDDGSMLGVVDLDEACRTVIGDGHRSHLDLHRALEPAVLVGGADCRAGQAAGDSFEIEQGAPPRLEVAVDGELVTEDHAPALNVVALSAPLTATAPPRPAARRTRGAADDRSAPSGCGFRRPPERPRRGRPATRCRSRAAARRRPRPCPSRRWA